LSYKTNFAIIEFRGSFNVVWPAPSGVVGSGNVEAETSFPARFSNPTRQQGTRGRDIGNFSDEMIYYRACHTNPESIIVGRTVPTSFEPIVWLCYLCSKPDARTAEMY
jgi:hypothetical protein